MLIDVHTHAILPDDGHVLRAEEQLLRAMDRYEIDRIYISNFVDLYPDEDEVDYANGEAERFMKEHPNRVEGYIYVSPELPNAMDVLRRGIEAQGFSGVKFWVSAFCDDQRFDPLVEKVEEYGVPLLLHCWHKATGHFPFEATGVHAANLAARHPNLKIIMAHFGGNCYHGIPAIRPYKNVWVDISGSVFRADELNYTVEKIGAERVLFGSDMPGTYLPNLGQVMEADLTQEEREHIYYKNAIKLFDRSYRCEEILR